MQATEAIQPMFLELRVIPQDPKLRISAHENLVDVLEICAVAAGRKPVHLHGHGLCDPAAFIAIEDVAKRYGLITKRTGYLASTGLCQEERRLGAVVQQALAQVNAQDRTHQQVLWVFSSSDVGNQIELAVSGDKKALKQLLGYPTCCFDYHEAEYLRFRDAYLRALQAQYGAQTPEEVARLITKNLPAKTDFHPFSPARSLFPYVSYTPCPACAKAGLPSPSGKLNQRMRDLAFVLDRDFGRSLWDSAREEDRSFGVMLRETTANGPCPCGSTKKMKACCDAW